jgi:hypothetical protein
MPLKVAQVFKPHKMPDGALPVRCHVLKEDEAQALEDFLVKCLPDCYTTKLHLKERAESTGLPLAELLANKLPDPGSVMSGDFGEVLTLFFLGSERAEKITPINKWRYKQDRKKAAPLSDVVLFYREHAATATENDFVICAEAKQKAMASKTYVPITKAVEGFEEDKTGRLGRTLVWLREKAIDHGSKDEINFLDRFTIDPSIKYLKHFKAVAIIDRDLLDEEITRQIHLPKQDEFFEVIVLGIKDLKVLYEKVYGRAPAEVVIE